MESFTKFNNDLLEALVLSNMNGSDFRVILLLIRETLGFHSNKAKIGVADIALILGLSKKSVSRSMKRLTDNGFISFNNSEITIHLSNKAWTTLSENKDKSGHKNGQDCPPYTLYKENKEKKEKRAHTLSCENTDTKETLQHGEDKYCGCSETQTRPKEINL